MYNAFYYLKIQRVLRTFEYSILPNSIFLFLVYIYKFAFSILFTFTKTSYVILTLRVEPSAVSVKLAIFKLTFKNIIILIYYSRYTLSHLIIVLTVYFAFISITINTINAFLIKIEILKIDRMARMFGNCRQQ